MKPKSKNVRVLLRGQEAGGITRADIERRARELALIRTGDESYSEADLRNAERELFGDNSPGTTSEDAGSEVFITRDPADPPGVVGHQRPEVSPDEDDENETPEQLALQGVEEAQHDLMVRSRRRSGENQPPDMESETGRR